MVLGVDGARSHWQAVAIVTRHEGRWLKDLSEFEFVELCSEEAQYGPTWIKLTKAAGKLWGEWMGRDSNHIDALAEMRRLLRVSLRHMRFVRIGKEPQPEDFFFHV